MSTLTLIERLPSSTAKHTSTLTLLLDAEERTRSRVQFVTVEGEKVRLFLPRGTVLKDGDLLLDQEMSVYVRVIAKEETVMTVIAKEETVMTVIASDLMSLAKAAYHLGNRHIPLEIGQTFLRLKPDHVLASMLKQMGFHIVEENAKFHPEIGSYKGPHTHEH